MFFLEFLTLIPKLFINWLRICILILFPLKKKTIHDDIVLITGGGRGIGRRLALEFTKYRPRLIILWGRNEDFLAATTKAIKLKNQACVYMCCDVGKKEQVYARAKEIKEKHGDVTVLVNNAGVTHGRKLLDATDSEIENVFNTNMMSHVWAVKAFLPAMLERDHGHIVNMNSMLGVMGLAGASDYSATKHASVGLSESLWFEIRSSGKENVHITNMHPYLVDTEMFAGCVTRYAWMFPPLDPDYVAKKTLDAMLTNTYSMFLPCLMYPVYWARCVLPQECMMLIRDLFWVDQAMDHFHSKSKPKTQKSE